MQISSVDSKSDQYLVTILILLTPHLGSEFPGCGIVDLLGGIQFSLQGWVGNLLHACFVFNGGALAHCHEDWLHADGTVSHVGRREADR